MRINKVEEMTLKVGGAEVFYRRVEGEGAPALFVHGNPTSSEQWLPFLRAIPRPAVALDLPGWGRSGRPRDFDYSMGGLAAFLGHFREALGIAEHSLVADDWGGGISLIAAQRDPGAVKRLVLINAVPLLPGYRWHWVARLWRRRGVGELVNTIATRPGTALLLRQARGGKPMPAEFVEMIWRHMDAGTKRSILALYRSADPEALAAAGAGLERLSMPALVIWGERDPYIPAEFGRRYAAALSGAELVSLPDAGHWPWIDRPDLVPRILSFLDAG